MHTAWRCGTRLTASLMLTQFTDGQMRTHLTMCPQRPAGSDDVDQRGEELTSQAQIPIGSANAARLALPDRGSRPGPLNAEGARPCCSKHSFQHLLHAFGDYGRIVVDGERYCALESVPGGNEYAKAAWNVSAAIHPSYGAPACLQPATRPLDTLAAAAWYSADVKTVSGLRHSCMRSWLPNSRSARSDRAAQTAAHSKSPAPAADTPAVRSSVFRTNSEAGSPECGIPDRWSS
jgi:hypothetical protein